MNNQTLIKIKINGIEKKIPKNTTLKKLLKDLQILDKTMAIAVNMQIIKKDKWDSYIIKENDKIEALNFVGGG